jgi:RNA polymerase sigma-70 factor, ECF subfamily
MIEAIEQFTIVDLVVAAQAGDRSAMDQLFVQFERQVQAIAVRRLGNWEEARELSQDVFIQAFRRLDQLNEPAAFGGWLRQITHRMAINRLMRKRVPLSVEFETLDANSSDDESPLQGVLRSEQREQVREGLARLGSLDRETLEAFYMNGQSLIEMSDAFDAPIGTIKRRLHVARKRLAKEVETLQAV